MEKYLRQNAAGRLAIDTKRMKVHEEEEKE